MPIESFPTLLATRLKALHLSQGQLRELLKARGLSVSRNTVSRWATGARTPDPVHLEAILDVMAVYGSHRRAIVYRLTYAPSGAVDVAPLVAPE